MSVYIVSDTVVQFVATQAGVSAKSIRADNQAACVAVCNTLNELKEIGRINDAMSLDTIAIEYLLDRVSFVIRSTAWRK